MAFNLFLAAIPMVALAGWALTAMLRGSPNTLGTASSLLNLTPNDVREIIDRHLGRLSAGAVAPIAVAGSFWLAAGAFHTLMTVFETSLQAKRRSWWSKRLIAMVCVVVTLLALGLSVPIAAAASGAPLRMVEELLGASEHHVTVGRYVTVVVGGCTLTTLLAGVYRIGLRRSGVQRRVWPGAVLAVAIGSISSSALAYYGQTLARFTLFYGSLAAVAVFLAWLWLWCAALLLGAELNTQLENEATATDPPP